MPSLRIYLKKKKAFERLLDSVCGTYEDDYTKCPYKEMCDEYTSM